MTTALKFFVLTKDEKEDRLKKDRLLSDIRGIKREMDCAYSRFEQSSDEDLIEASIYELQALSRKYQVLLKTAKRENLQSSDLTSLYEFERRFSV